MKEYELYYESVLLLLGKPSIDLKKPIKKCYEIGLSINMAVMECVYILSNGKLYV